MIFTVDLLHFSEGTVSTSQQRKIFVIVTGICLFCGKTAKLTREHVWPRWLSNYFRSKDVHPGTFTLARNGKVTGERSIIDITRRCLCEVCNNVWLGGLEDRIKPLISQMMDGSSCSLEPDEQRECALWLTKIHMLLTQFDPGFASMIPIEHLRHMRDTNTPPSTYNVWIGRFMPEGKPTFSSEHHIMEYRKPDKDGVVRGNLYLTSLRFHHFLGQVFGYYDLDGESHRLNEGLGGSQYALEIWPSEVTRCDWPPSMSFTADTFNVVRRMRVAEK